MEEQVGCGGEEKNTAQRALDRDQAKDEACARKVAGTHRESQASTRGFPMRSSGEQLPADPAAPHGVIRRMPDPSVRITNNAPGEGFNDPDHAAQRYSWISRPSTSRRSTGIRMVPRVFGARSPADTAKPSPRCGLSFT